MDLSQFLAWDDAGPVAILMVVVVGLALISRWLLSQLIADKNSQIARLERMNDKAVEETAATLKQILDALRERKETER